MARRMWLSIIMLAMFASGANSVIFMMIHDAVDDWLLVDAVSGQKPVKEFAAEIDAFAKILDATNQQKFEKLLGKPVKRPGKDYAMTLGQSRKFAISGIRAGVSKEHTEFYAVGDFAGIEVHYRPDGENPWFALLCFKVDDAFPKLKVVEEKAADKPAAPTKTPAATRKHTIDEDHWHQLSFLKKMNKQQVAELFSAPAGDYAPGTDYLTRCWGESRSLLEGKVQETLEWRSEKGRIVVSFDEQGIFLTSEFYRVGRDPVTNVAERLKWDRAKFARVKKFVEERMAAK